MAQTPNPSNKPKSHALHDLKDFVFSPVGLAFTIGLILVVHWLSTKPKKA